MIRLFCAVTGQLGDFWGDLGFAYFTALRQIRPIRVVPLLGPAGVDIGAGRWARHGDTFVVDPGKHYINVVCGDNGPLLHYFTVGVPNLAITAVRGRWPTEYEVGSLANYDLVVCPTVEDVGVLSQRAITALCAPADPDAMDRLLRGLE